MPIRQLKRKKDEQSSTSFSTHSFGQSREKTPDRVPSFRSAPYDFLRRVPMQRLKERRSGRGMRVSRSFMWWLLRAGLIVFFLGGIFMISIFAWYSKDLPDPNKIIDRDVAQSTKIYDRIGETLLYEIHGTERRTLIELTDIPQYAIDATVAVEDKNFFKHKGLSATGIVRAITLEILSKLHLFNRVVPGGSTLTQQFIKNAVLTREKSYVRKIKEFVLAYRLEQKFTKDEILKLYFNEIPYGSTAYGIEAAAGIYFDKPAHDLTLAEAAVLAALPQAPSYYSPYGSHKDELIARQRFILKLMVEQEYITDEQAEDARNQEIVFKKRREDIKAPHFVFMVKEELSQRYGERLVEQGGLKIITTLDAEKQKVAEEVITEKASENFEKFEAQNASLVSIDVPTGEIVALVGSRDFFDEEIEGQVNVATALRQPGSSLKPIIYAEAFNRGYRPDTIVYDLVTSFAASGKEYKPHNYDSIEHGPVTLRTALQGSLNIPAVKVLYLIGVRRAVELAQELGYTTLIDPDRYGLALVLGGGEVKLIEHVNAYAAFARDGVFKPYTSVLRVEDGNGDVLEEHKSSSEKRVLPREVARTLTSVLSDNGARAFIFGENNYLTLGGRPVAAKTGTTNDYRDAWTIGYTPSIATGVWVGNSRNEEMKRGADGSVLAAPIWRNYMQRVLEGTPVEGFKQPEPLPPCNKPMLCGTTGEKKVRINSETGKLAGPFTPESKIKEVSFRESHSILHYVDRSDPTGPVPEHPENDPQYPLWEAPIQAWAAAQGYTNDQPPTETDTLYRPEDQPMVNFISPSQGGSITIQPYTFQVSASSVRGVRRVEYFLNDISIGSITVAPFSLPFNPTPKTPNGSYTLKAVASDDLGNEGRATIQVTLSTDRTGEWGVLWSNMTNGKSYINDELPPELSLEITNPLQLKKIDYYLEAPGGSKSFIGFENVVNRSVVTHSWSPPSQAGIYSLSVVVTDAFNESYAQPALTFTVQN